jgi:hypothetical protein
MTSPKSLWRLRFAGCLSLTGIAALLLMPGSGPAEDRPRPRPADRGKMVIETPTKQILAGNTANTPAVARAGLALPAGVTKGQIERPTEALLAKRSGPSPAATAGDFVNPKVEPGRVRWHGSFDEACRASARSGKPVLLFQMMGKLDDQFC